MALLTDLWLRSVVFRCVCWAELCCLVANLGLADLAELGCGEWVGWPFLAGLRWLGSAGRA